MTQEFDHEQPRNANNRSDYNLFHRSDDARGQRRFPPRPTRYHTAGPFEPQPHE